MTTHGTPQNNPPHTLLPRPILAFLTLLAAATLACLPLSQPAHAETNTATSLRDGSHDFDFNFGVWHTHIRRVLNPFSPSSKTVELNGTVTVRKVWNGRAQLEEIEADGPNGHWEGATLFLYNPQSHQWSQSFIDSKAAELETPMIGEFNNNRGELFSNDTVDGKAVLARGVWSNITPNSHHFEISNSNDGGKTWAPAFIADLTREQPADAPNLHADAAPPSGPDVGQRDFDFDLGTWKTHSTRLLHPLTGSTTWVQMDGTTVISKVWGGRANLAEYSADGTAGHVELLALRWFNPTTHQWSIDFASPPVGTLGIPGVGAFLHGRADFYDFEPINGRSVLVRFSIWSTGPDTAQSEQAFSPDGGKTWEVNWINKYTRAHAE